MQGESFVKVYDKILTEEQCKKIIDSFELINDQGGVFARQDYESSNKSSKDDYSLQVEQHLGVNINQDIYLTMLGLINRNLSIYIQTYISGMFPNQSPVDISQAGVKIQKTEPSQGYHQWHCENSLLKQKGRILAWILYLNDIEEGGETEFLHLSQRVKPKAGSLLVFPAGWTHTHRGNPPLKIAKYIATGWVEYTE